MSQSEDSNSMEEDSLDRLWLVVRSLRANDEKHVSILKEYLTQDVGLRD